MSNGAHKRPLRRVAQHRVEMSGPAGPPVKPRTFRQPIKINTQNQDQLQCRKRIPYRQIGGLTVGHLHIAGGVATITDPNGAERLIESDVSPVLCGPRALVRRRCLLDVTVATKTRMSEFLTKKAKEVTEASHHHPCQDPQPIDPKTLELSLFPPINRWGHLPVQIRPLTPRSVSRPARQA